MFAATGLLSQGPTLSITTPNDIPESTSFVSTGLLGAPTLGSGDPEISQSLEVSMGTAGSSHSESSSAFVSTGLLSSSSASTSYISGPSNSTSASQEFDDSELPSISEAFNITSRPISAPKPSMTYIPRASVRATTYDGKTIYLKRKPKSFLPETATSSSSSSSSRQPFGKLLDVPIHRLMDQLSSTTAADIQRAEQAAAAPSSDAVNLSIEDALWVDRYRPLKFTDLVGNDKVARDALTWIKEWDFCVFGKTRGKKRSRDGDENVNQDKYRRPQEKILLLSGPPGLGKTTLAHVLAKQAGYEVMEINASDARSGSIVDDRIRPTLESGSAIGSSKPVLLVIDEIDGATGAGDNASTFIHKLVQLIQAKPFKKRNKKDQDGPRPILRPIICICNDLNSSSLTKLRPHALSIRFHRPPDIHIVNRLKEICRVEGMKADSRSLTTLVAAARGDLRGCLNTLQFIKTRGEDVTESVVRKATSGLKEADTNYLSVLNNLFTPLSKKRVKELGVDDDEEGKFVARLSHEISGSGRESNIASGCFGHYATRRRHDANLSRHQQGIEWLRTFDTFSSAMYADGDFALNQYLAYTLVPFYPLFQQRGGDRVERNQADWEHFQQTRSNEEVLNSLSACLRTATIRYGGDFRHLLCHPVLQLEFTPYINRIISPPLRPVNSQIIRPQEKALMTRLVDIMSSLELRFVQERADDGQLSYRLDPPVDVFVTYDGKRAADIMVSRYAVRHLVAGEIETNLIARDSEFVEKGKRGKHNFFGKSRSSDDNVMDSTAVADGDSVQPNKRAKLDTRDIADKPPTDFFGRLITVATANSNSTNTAAHKIVPKNFNISYKFLEGNSAAVRKPVKVNMFL